ncbi:class I SAM-dependent methyltransferase [Pseudofrankia inefficax]|uniref:Methyltransferase type 11 n=1 Tax=Pseudofrankia inefficax (strain DSM 45817 / CECT 9037 / DDB 130130 / EuI1c) TaxID=298654 RepID=E3J259_PSEI1|nr:class I SAM-dependent methyltransferase [Pseudofrankia inefficax]ADP78097.1 Methyltransferase type 11 [Pseudofrankia inefficax]
MLTVDFDRFPVGPGDRVLDLGCGGGRHAFEAYRRGADVVGLDYSFDDVAGVARMFGAMALEGQVPASGRAGGVRGDAFGLPFADGTFDRVIASEILEHLPADEKAMAELVRVLRPGGLAAVTVPAWLPERLCWALSSGYHTVEGGHVRIYRRDELLGRLTAAGLEYLGGHSAHALHAPYWWLRCLVGVHDDNHPATKLYHRMLVWDMMKRPRTTRWTEQLLNPVLGKSVVFYLRKPLDVRQPTVAVPGPATAQREAFAETGHGVD